MVIQPRHGGREVRGLVHFRQIADDTPGVDKTSGGITFHKIENGKWSVRGTTKTRNIFCNITKSGAHLDCPVGHSLLVVTTTTDENAYALYASTGGTPVSVLTKSELSVPIVPTSIGSSNWLRLQANYLSPSQDFYPVTIDAIVRPMAFDLTVMFADCPELMPSSVAEFKALFPADYYPYTEQPYDVII